MGEGMTPEEFQKRLDAIFTYKGVAYGHVELLLEEEEKHSKAVLQFQGYLSLSAGLKCVFLEAVELFNTQCRPKITRAMSEFYGIYVARLAHGFQSLCGAERSAIRGYPLLAYTSLRNIFDNVVLSSAAMQKFTDFYAIEGIEPGKPFDPDEARKLRKKTESAVRRLVTGQQSGLSLTTIEELSKWDALFDYETHGARLSLASAMEWIKGRGPLSVLPQFDARDFGIFLNRYCEIAWMAHRLLPLIQAVEAPLPEKWKQKWRVVDDSFRITVEALTDQSGKKIGAAMVEFVNSKFPFGADSAFPL
jgi:hypothetical protein